MKVKEKKVKLFAALVIFFLLFGSSSSALAYDQCGDKAVSAFVSRLDSFASDKREESVDIKETECIQLRQLDCGFKSEESMYNNQNKSGDEEECQRTQWDDDKKELNANLIFGCKVYDGTSETENINLFYCPEAIGIQPGDDVYIGVKGEFESKNTGMYNLPATITGKDAEEYYFEYGRDEIACVILPKPIQQIIWTCDEFNGHYFKYDGSIKKPTGKVTLGILTGDDVRIGKSITTTEQSLETALTSVIGTDIWHDLLNEIKTCGDLSAFFRDKIMSFMNDIMIQWKTEATERCKNGYFEFALSLEGVDAENYCILDFEPIVKALFETECGSCSDKDVNLTMPGIPENVFWWFNIKQNGASTPISPKHVNNNVASGISDDSSALNVVVALIILAGSIGFVLYKHRFTK